MYNHIPAVVQVEEHQGPCSVIINTKQMLKCAVPVKNQYLHLSRSLEIVPERLGVRKTKTKLRGKYDAKLKFPEGGGGRVQIKMSSVWIFLDQPNQQRTYKHLTGRKVDFHLFIFLFQKKGTTNPVEYMQNSEPMSQKMCPSF